MTDPDEAELSQLARKMLATPPKKREDAKFGKPKVKTEPKPDAEPRKPKSHHS